MTEIDHVAAATYQPRKGKMLRAVVCALRMEFLDGRHTASLKLASAAKVLRRLVGLF